MCMIQSSFFFSQLVLEVNKSIEQARTSQLLALETAPKQLLLLEGSAAEDKAQGTGRLAQVLSWRDSVHCLGGVLFIVLAGFCSLRPLQVRRMGITNKAQHQSHLRRPQSFRMGQKPNQVCSRISSKSFAPRSQTCSSVSRSTLLLLICPLYAPL